MNHVSLPEAKLQISWGDLHPHLVFSEESFKGTGRNTAHAEAWLLGLGFGKIWKPPGACFLHQV